MLKGSENYKENIKIREIDNFWGNYALFCLNFKSLTVSNNHAFPLLTIELITDEGI